MARQMIEEGRLAMARSTVTALSGLPVFSTSVFSISATPSNRVGPGRK